jgi:pantoate--beta-alanine ligase
MLIARTLPDLRSACVRLRDDSGALALVPTMGALHQGHRTLVRTAVASGAATVASIFVNPLQFAPNEDLSRYPRDEAGDLEALRAEGCALAWLPDVATMYPAGEATAITVGGPAERWEGDARPGHFRGVATVCAKLFGQVRPDRAYFGEKDWQQLQLVRGMAAALFLPVEIIPCPTVRDADGLALSSRNRRLSPAARKRAAAFPRILRESPAPSEAARALGGAGFGVDYVEDHDGVRLGAVRLEDVRLIDNVRL